jgi:hypothetical protein
MCRLTISHTQLCSIGLSFFFYKGKILLIVDPQSTSSTCQDTKVKTSTLGRGKTNTSKPKKTPNSTCQMRICDQGATPNRTEHYRLLKQSPGFHRHS